MDISECLLNTKHLCPPLANTVVKVQTYTWRLYHIIKRINEIWITVSEWSKINNIFEKCYRGSKKMWLWMGIERERD